MTTTDLQSIPQTTQVIDDDDTINTYDTTNKNISIEAIAALRREGMSLQRIADALGCSKQNIHYRIRDADDFVDFGKCKDHKFENLQRKIYNSIDQGKHQKSSLLQDVTALGILEDKIRMLRGQATLRIESFSVTASLDDLERRKQELLKTVRCTTVQDVVPTTDNVTS